MRSTRASRTPTVLRRSFLGAVGASITAACGSASSDPEASSAQPGGAASSPPGDAAQARAGEIPRRPLGSTGEQVSIVGLGGHHIGLQKDEAESLRIIRTAIDRGVTFLDNCWDYHRGRSEERMGKALQGGYREKVLLMTKIDGRTRDAATQQLEQSLARLQTDVIDLLQIHEIIRAEDPARCFAAGGCIEALVAAKKAGKIRFIGFTGHKDPEFHLAMLKAADEHGFRFDAVQLPLNVMDAHYRSFEKRVLPLLVERKIAVLGMKALGSGDILKSQTVSAVECLHYALNLPTSVVITGCDSLEVLDQAVRAARSFAPLSAQAVTALLDRSRQPAADGRHERFKISEQFDGTTKNPKWLEGAEV